MALPSDLSGPALHRFIGGRRRHNAQRQAQAMDRRMHLLFVWRQHPGLSRADLARRFGVHRSTITRDVQWLKRHWRQAGTCPICDQPMPGRDLVAEAEWLSDVARTAPGAMSVCPPTLT